MVGLLLWLVGIGTLMAGVVYSTRGELEMARFLILAGLLFTLQARVENLANRKGAK